MRRFFSRLSAIYALVVKEFQIIWSDPMNRVVLVVFPILQMTLFAYTASLEIKNISLVIYDQDRTPVSRALTEKFANTPTVEKIEMAQSREQVTDLINRQKGYMAVVIPQDFSKKIYDGSGASLQFILDGRKSNAAQIVLGYASEIVSAFQGEILGVSPAGTPIEVVVRNWFNPNLDYQWFIVISLTGALALSMMLSVTALSVAQEKELGTFDQIVVSPLKPYEILIGKTIPALAISLLDVAVMMIGGSLFFGIPLEGSVIGLYACVSVFLLSIAGIGLFISTLCQTQQQAILGVFTFLAPAFLLSGFVTPVENMPPVLQKVAAINPLTYFFSLMKGIYLKDMTFGMIMENVFPLLIISFLTLGFAGWFFNKKLD